MRERSGEKKAVREDMRDNEQGADITLVLFESHNDQKAEEGR